MSVDTGIDAVSSPSSQRFYCCLLCHRTLHRAVSTPLQRWKLWPQPQSSWYSLLPPGNFDPATFAPASSSGALSQHLTHHLLPPGHSHSLPGVPTAIWRMPGNASYQRYSYPTRYLPHLPHTGTSHSCRHFYRLMFFKATCQASCQIMIPRRRRILFYYFQHEAIWNNFYFYWLPA